MIKKWYHLVYYSKLVDSSLTDAVLENNDGYVWIVMYIAVKEFQFTLEINIDWTLCEEDREKWTMKENS